MNRGFFSSVDEGRRQIFSFHQPGDIPDLQSLYLHVMDHDASLLLMIVCWDSSRTIPYAGLIRRSPEVAEALWRDTLIDALQYSGNGFVILVGAAQRAVWLT
jgi:hypothetical protein